jgi:hypothetical protein
MVEYEQIAEQAQSELLKANEQLRTKTAECEQLKSKITIQAK